MTRVLIWVQHLLGAGHLERMRWVAEALAARGAGVWFATGGVPRAGRMPRDVNVVQLPPIRVADARFAPLLDAAGQPLTDAYRRERREALLAAFAAARPDVVVLETWPFGRRALAFELEPLLARLSAIEPRPRVVASVRDLLQVRADPARNAAIWQVARTQVDEILVHGDPAFARLEDTFPPAADGAVPLTYTGYVVAPEARADAVPADERSEIVAAASGGDAGREGTLAATIAARALSRHAASTWRVLVGPGVADADYAALAQQGRHAGVIVRAPPGRLPGPGGKGARIGVAGGLQHDPGRARRAHPGGAGAVRRRGRDRAGDARRAAGRARPRPKSSPSATSRRRGSPRRSIAPPRAASGRRGRSRPTARHARPSASSRSRGSAPGRCHDVRGPRRRGSRAGPTRAGWRRSGGATTTVATTPALATLAALARAHDVPVALAAVPAALEDSLAATVVALPQCTVVQHGCAHRNHAPAGAKSCEPAAAGRLRSSPRRLGAGTKRLHDAFGPRFLPLLVPLEPHRRDGRRRAAVARLRRPFHVRAAHRAQAAPGLVRCNAHVDPIAWRDGRRFVGPARALDEVVAHLARRRAGTVDADEPTGLLTHHLVFDAEAWRFVGELLARTRRHPAARWLAVEAALGA
ncbi:MAG: hypothetical protein MZW92_32330 [Comamonadaceae bacterium]|nr:hypothetical protein [Comamonadaceae bacterium]